MKYIQIDPSAGWHSNGVLKGNGPVRDLAITRWVQEDQMCTTSFYQLSLWTRIRFLFSGKIYVSIFGETHPPIALGVGDMFTKGK